MTGEVPTTDIVRNAVRSTRRVATGRGPAVTTIRASSNEEVRMIKSFVFVMLVVACGTGASAESLGPDGAVVEIEGWSQVVAGPVATELDGAEIGASGKRGGVTVEAVGDPDSFGRAQTYLGLVQTRTVQLAEDCTGYPPEAGPCIELEPAPALTHVEELDLGVIELPGRSTHSLLCFTMAPFARWEWSNDTGVRQMAFMFLRPAFRIESHVLDDPSLVDPGTGLPFNGFLTEGTVTTFLQNWTLDPGEVDAQCHAETRACTGGLFSERVLRDVYGLPDSVIRDFFRNPIAVTIGARGFVSMMSWTSISVGVRLYGD
jgi:hypothetical protein